MRRLLTLLIPLMLLAGCTGSNDEPDGDGDLVDDAIETEGVVIDIVLLTGVERRLVTSDPETKDTDGDGLTDGEELRVRQTDPRDADTDDDGLLDGDDKAAPSEASRATWRAQGILEINGTFLGELDACPPGGAQLRANVSSSDLPIPDQLLDGEELRGWDITVRGGTRHVTSDPCVPDTDKDGLFDHEEKLRLTDPRSSDTDSDGTPDGSDAEPLWDLALGFADLDVDLDDGSNASAVRLVFTHAGGSADLVWPGNASATLDVPDQGKGSLEMSIIVTAEDLATGERLKLFEDPRGAILVFDLIDGTASGASTEGAKIRFAGDDGSMTFTWSVLRR